MTMPSSAQLLDSLLVILSAGKKFIQSLFVNNL